MVQAFLTKIKTILGKKYEGDVKSISNKTYSDGKKRIIENAEFLLLPGMLGKHILKVIVRY